MIVNMHMYMTIVYVVVNMYKYMYMLGKLAMDIVYDN